MAIGVEGQYIFRFDLGSKTDFINEENLGSFTLIEQVGNILPRFELSFITLDDEILSHLHEGNDLRVSFGRNTNDLTDATLAIIEMESSKKQSARDIGVAGLYSAIKYTTETNNFISEELNALEVMNEIVSQHFIPEFNIEADESLQRWIQYNISDMKFINQLWLHSFLEESFIATGITSDGRFLAVDVKKSFEDDFAFKFTQKESSSEPNSINYDSDFSLKVDRGFVNNFVGYPRERLIFGFEDGAANLVTEQVEPLLSLTQNFAKRADIEKRFNLSGVINQNTHVNYWRAAQKNLAHWISFGDTTITLSFSNAFFPIKILDVVMFKDDSSQKFGQSAEAHSGLYIVTKVSRNVGARQFSTVVELSRESLNQIQGEFVTNGVTAT